MLGHSPVNNSVLEELFDSILGWLGGAEGSSREPLLKLLSDEMRVKANVTDNGKHQDTVISDS